MWRYVHASPVTREREVWFFFNMKTRVPTQPLVQDNLLTSNLHRATIWLEQQIFTSSMKFWFFIFLFFLQTTRYVLYQCVIYFNIFSRISANGWINEINATSDYSKISEDDIEDCNQTAVDANRILLNLGQQSLIPR